jgi:hypothetical protein
LDSSVETVQLAFEAIDLAPRLCALCGVHPGRRAGQPTGGAAQDRRGDLQIAHRLGGRVGDGWLHRPLRFEQQLRLFEKAGSDLRRALPPGGIQWPGLPGVEPMPRQRRRHPLAVVQADAGRRRQILHRDMRRDPALAHLLLDALRQ